MPAGSAWFKAVDLTGVSGTTNITLCTVTVRGDTEGTTTLTLTADTVEDRSGGVYTPTLTSAQFAVSSANPFPKPGGGFFPAPTDPNNDGKYEDLDGNGWIGFNDVVIYYTNMETIGTGAYGSVSKFDYDNSGFIGFNDVVKLYSMTG
jgi:PKD repeat protein